MQKSYHKRSDGQYEVCLPFKNENMKLPNNSDQVLKRLLSLKKKLHCDQEYYNEYNEFMNMMLEKKFAEKVPDCELSTEAGKVWYLFHFGVRHKQKKKIRIVFDASLRYNGICLNDLLLQGPDLTSSLLGVLLRFREGKMAVLADIQKMFYAVKVSDQHKNYLRFYWFPNGDLSKDPVQYRVTVHIFGAVSSPSVANYVLKASAHTEEARHFSEAAKKTVKTNFYVDDLLKSMDSASELSYLLDEVVRMLQFSGFKLTGFASNCREILRTIDKQELAKNFTSLDLQLDELPYERALGMFWNVEKDTFEFKLNIQKKEQTKRGILSSVFSVYDPLGLVAPIILVAKRIFQMTCNLNLGWDDPLPIGILEPWTIWLDAIGQLTSFQVPRCLKLQAGGKQFQLHFFCDGSEKAYACAAYVRSEMEDDSISCSLLLAKTRLVPLKGTAFTTVPRIELNAARLAVTVYETLKSELTLKIEEVFFWTDSTTVLKYLNNTTNRYQRFVSNRISFIREHTNITSWRFVPSQENPADIASRGATVNELLKSDIWVSGPEFLLESTDEWPRNPILEEISEDDPELVKSKLIFATQVEILQANKPTDLLLKSSSSWTKIKIRVAAFLLFKRKLNKQENLEVCPALLMEAEKNIFKYIQNKFYRSIISILENKNKIMKKNPLSKLNPFIDKDGLLRVGGRLSNALNIPYESKHPVIIPSEHHITEILVRFIHEKLGHMGKETILAELRQQYWIVGANKLVKRILRACIACRKRQGRASNQIMSDLPEDRLTADAPVFSQVGLDAFGPFVVIRRRTQVKRYGLIITCLSSRALHIETLASLETTAFINALRRFIARRGNIFIVRSDNGTNFVGAEKELRDSIDHWNSKQTKDWMLQKNITWTFNPPTASHFGGVWEREIRSIRKVISGLANEQPLHLDDDGINTLFCEVESILNSRPLTANSQDPNDLEALTPNHLLLARSGPTFPPGLFSREDIYARRKWKQVQYLANLFWTRWKREYITILQKRQKWTKESRSLAVGDLVLLVDENLHRNLWSLGRIEKVHEDRLNRVRVVDVRVSKLRGELKTKSTVVQRPIAKLVLLKTHEELSS